METQKDVQYVPCSVAPGDYPSITGLEHLSCARTIRTEVCNEREAYQCWDGGICLNVWAEGVMLRGNDRRLEVVTGHCSEECRWTT